MALPPLIIAGLVVGGVVIFGGVGVVLWLIFSKGKKQFPFLIYGVNGEISTSKGTVKVDPGNKTNKKFFIEGTDQSLPIRPPTSTIGGIAYREVMYDQNGDLQYIQKKVNRDKAMDIGLIPEEKQIALFRIKENERRYENPMGKAQAYMLLSMFVLIFILILGIVFSVISFTKNTDQMVQISETNRDSLKIQKNVADSNARVVEQLAGIMAAMTEGKNITRTLT